MTAPLHAPHFDSVGQQAHAARLGTWVFLGSELLFFTGLFTTYGTYRQAYPEVFAAASSRTDLPLMTVGTLLLLTASLLAALSVGEARVGRQRGVAWQAGLAALLGLGFLGLKGLEYAHHVARGELPGIGPGDEPGRGLFWTLYWLTTGLHAVHVVVGVALLGAVAAACRRGALPPHRAHVVENCANYWHFVDVIWLFVWPMFYLMRGGGP